MHNYTEELYDGVIDESKILKLHTIGKLPRDLMLSPQEYLKLQKEYDDLITPVPRIPMTSTRKVYCGGFLGLYAKEDYLDSILCRASGSLGYDIVILLYIELM